MWMPLIMLTSFITVYLIFFFVFDTLIKKRQVINIRLDRISKEDMKDKDSELNQSLFTRIIKPLFDQMSKGVLRIAPKEIITLLDKKVITAGTPYNLQVKDWINIQALFIVCFPLATAATGYYKDYEIRKVLFAVIIEIVLGLILPSLILSKKVNDRQRVVINTLPDVLDLLTVSVEAGLGFDGALAKVVDKVPGPLAFEFENVLQEIKVGKKKKDALKDMSDRVGVNDLSSFVGSIIQADQLGVSIGNVLRIQSEQMRQRRKQRAQEKAMKAPVKMLIPMILFIFPTIFSVLLGPVVIKMINVFTGR